MFGLLEDSKIHQVVFAKMFKIFTPRTWEHDQIFTRITPRFKRPLKAGKDPSEMSTSSMLHPG